jgi:hypothetical protein
LPCGISGFRAVLPYAPCLSSGQVGLLR